MGQGVRGSGLEVVWSDGTGCGWGLGWRGRGLMGQGAGGVWDGGGVV